MDSWHGLYADEPGPAGKSITAPFDPLTDVMQEAADTLTVVPKPLWLGLWPEWSRANGGTGCGPGLWMEVLHALARRSVDAGGILRAFEWRVCYPGPDLPHDDTGDGRRWPEGAMKLPPFPPRPDAAPDAAADWAIDLPDDTDLYDPPAGLWEALPSRWYGFVPDAGRASAAACLLLAGWEPERPPAVGSEQPSAAAPSVAPPPTWRNPVTGATSPGWAVDLFRVQERMRRFAEDHPVGPLAVVLTDDDDGGLLYNEERGVSADPHPSRVLALSQPNAAVPPRSWVNLLNATPRAWPGTCIRSGHVSQSIGRTVDEVADETGNYVARGVHAALPPNRLLVDGWRDLPREGVARAWAEEADPDEYEAEHRRAFDAVRRFLPLLDDAGAAVRGAMGPGRDGPGCRWFATVGPDLYARARPRALFLWAAADLAASPTAKNGLWAEWRREPDAQWRYLAWRDLFGLCLGAIDAMLATAPAPVDPPAAPSPIVLPAAPAAPTWAKGLREVREEMRDAKRRHAVPPIPAVLIQFDDPRVTPHVPPDPSRCFTLAHEGDDARPPRDWVRLDGWDEPRVGVGKLTHHKGAGPDATGRPGEPTGTVLARGLWAALPPTGAKAERFKTELAKESPPLPGWAARIDPARCGEEHAAALAAVRSLALLLDAAGDLLSVAPAGVRSGVFHTVGPEFYRHAGGRRLLLWAAFDLALRCGRAPPLCQQRRRAYGTGGRLELLEPEWAEGERIYAARGIDMTPPGWWFVRLPDLFAAALAATDLLAEANGSELAIGKRAGGAGDTGDTPKETADPPAAFDPWPTTDREFIKRMVAARPDEQREYIRAELERTGFNVTDRDVFGKRVEALRKKYGRTRRKLQAAGQW